MRSSIKSVFDGFKDFLMRGNVIDLAVAVVMGTAFTAVVTSFTKGLVNPLLAVFGSTNELGLGVQLIADKPATFIALGPIITAFIDFFMVAVVLYFVLMLPMNSLKNRFGTTKAAEPTETELLIEIRDLLAKQQGLSSEQSEELSKERATESA
ncbi:large conductance mechanosensitive channel protein MscL [Nocardia rhizosphaerihabitans]|uniref:Large-conductance mechanosensitive channel n=1 Tax=Nocardia rhizosphaerihabitans TaxID=1691570 RepID=A0ABQ2K784_9NOCA|nr:large conductance mechanosensitive channel protein MscL [Nocardia rhizosphaerihabitans]GGN73053.1 large conductance mechanosensitive channel protein MscL [Nocardia rhizosphaerihabitans]